MSQRHVLIISGSTSRKSATRDFFRAIAGGLEAAGRTVDARQRYADLAGNDPGFMARLRK